MQKLLDEHLLASVVARINELVEVSFSFSINSVKHGLKWASNTTGIYIHASVMMHKAIYNLFINLVNSGWFRHGR